ncbi:MAG: hypothetical protein LPK00_10285 [Bacillaceae bacterium]|nr:hypothetical protein [Bacillaceae bacterium]
MSTEDYFYVVEKLGESQEKLNGILELINMYKESEVMEQLSIQLELKQKLKDFKEQNRVEIRLIIIQNMEGYYTYHYLLPALSITNSYLSEIGPRNININSQPNVKRLINKVKFVLDDYYNQLLNRH